MYHFIVLDQPMLGSQSGIHLADHPIILREPPTPEAQKRLQKKGLSNIPQPIASAPLSADPARHVVNTEIATALMDNLLTLKIVGLQSLLERIFELGMETQRELSRRQRKPKPKAA